MVVLTGAEMVEIIVDPEDEWLLKQYTWHVGNKGYAATNVVLQYGGEGTRRRKYTLLHHCIVGQPIWGWDEIDHINHNRTDNRRCNLRYVSKSMQNQNTTRKPGQSGARHIGITYLGTYRVDIRRDNVQHYLGCFDTMEEALATRDQWLHKYKECVS